MWIVLSTILIPLILLVLYVRVNDAKLLQIPPRALELSPKRCMPSDVPRLYQELKEAPISIDDQIPTKTGRRYIVVGGTGFLGGWIVMYLLRRGEDPKSIRVIDIRAPTRRDLLERPGSEVDIRLLDISDAHAVDEAFKSPWATSNDAPITVFHTAANIRFFERHQALFYRSTNVNVKGTKNILDSARAIGAETLVYTSSGAISVRSSMFLVPPWRRESRHFVQVLNEDDNLVPKRHEDFFSNYSASKWRAEQAVRGADGSSSNGGKTLRTGCIRPGNGVFGPGGDLLVDAYMTRGHNPTWVGPILDSFIYVENCALTHLLYERRLIDIATLPPSPLRPDIGGQAFVVSDPGPPPTNSDVYTILEVLSNGQTRFPAFSPTIFLMMAYIIEAFYLARTFLLDSPVPWLANFVPHVRGDFVNLQPSLWNLVMSHTIFDDSKARLPVEKGGLGYKGGWTTLQGVLRTVEVHQEGTIGRTHRATGFSFGLKGAQKAAGKVTKPVESLAVDAGN
ncbi:NAD-P-binding protein [Flagelloscypha sp. PMI_526]|nr:NAD-P-binding protein [Flagelloscypha sp. PMI_526]